MLNLREQWVSKRGQLWKYKETSVLNTPFQEELNIWVIVFESEALANSGLLFLSEEQHGTHGGRTLHVYFQDSRFPVACVDTFGSDLFPEYRPCLCSFLDPSECFGITCVWRLCAPHLKTRAVLHDLCNWAGFLCLSVASHLWCFFCSCCRCFF